MMTAWMKKTMLLVFTVIFILTAAGGAFAEEWVCENCGTANAGKYCAECGTARPDTSPWTCPVCGTENTGKYCTECGVKAPTAFGRLSGFEQDLILDMVRLCFLGDYDLASIRITEIRHGAIYSADRVNSLPGYLIDGTYLDEQGQIRDISFFAQDSGGFRIMNPIERENIDMNDFSETDPDPERLNQAFREKSSDAEYIENVKKNEIQRAEERLAKDEAKLQRWIEGGKKSEADIEKQKAKVEQDRKKLDALYEKYGY